MAAAAPPIGLKQVFRDAFTTPAGIAAALMLGVLAAMVVALPVLAPGDVVRSWRDPTAWSDNPRTAAPEWVDYFTAGRSPRSVNIQPEDFRKDRFDSPLGPSLISLRHTFDYQYDGFPSELTLWLFSDHGNISPFVSFELERPDGQKITLLETAPTQRIPIPNTYRLSRTESFPETLKTIRLWAITTFNATDTANPKPHVTLFAVGGEDMLDANRAQILKGKYTLLIRALAFRAGDDLDGKVIVYGRIFGLAGTDTVRRDLTLGLMWGAPVALAFGVVAGLSVVLIQTTLGAISGWYGGRADEIIQRAADFNLVLPLLPILIIISLFYQPSIWNLLIIVVAFGIVGTTTKVIRSIVLQVREEQFIESAQSYGAGKTRILFKHIFPRVMPYTFALIALAVPSYIFLEASLSFLGLGDPTRPTWGNLMGTAQMSNALYNGFWWWIALPAVAIVFTTVAFALMGYAFDKVLNPRLREQ